MLVNLGADSKLRTLSDMQGQFIIENVPVGSPRENGFFIDNIEVPNINHFPVWGSTGGPIGLLNGEFIKEVDFYAGGFSSL